ncbi:hypothetical protein K439DRAFT_1622558 [Ramaria rubella]|nr:hypothetical protein K439DRAFT_1622558 [Ramaria rubella]
MAQSYVIVAAFAYDTLLTFPSEIRVIWHKKFRLGTMLYLLARYPALLELLLTVYFDLATFPSLQCFGLIAYNWSSRSLIFYDMPACETLLFARAYAISSHNKLVFVMLALLGTVSIALFMIAIPNSTCISTSNIFALYVIKFLSNDIHSSNTVETLNGVFTILFDTTVFIAIIENTLGLLQLQRGIPEVQRNSLSKFLVQQEINRQFRFVLTITLANAVTLKVLRMQSLEKYFLPQYDVDLLRHSEIQAVRPTLQGILNSFQNSLSVIIICHFHLDLQQRNDHPNGKNTSHSLPLGSFHAVTERIHRAVVDEFGDLSFNESFVTEGSQEDIELQNMQSPSGVAEIDLQEFPWAGGDIGDEEAGPVASGSGILRE